MDGVSAAASILAVIQVSAQVCGFCHKYYLGVKDARKQIQRLSDELTSLHDVLENLMDLHAKGVKLSSLSKMARSDGPLDRCRKDLLALQARLDPGAEEDQMKRFGLRALKWPLDSKDVEKAIAVIERQKSTLNLALSTDQTNMLLLLDHNQHRIEKEIKDTRQEAAAARIDGRLTTVLRWLQTADPSINYNTACKKRQPESGIWLVEGNDFVAWRNAPASLMWLYGIGMINLYDSEVETDAHQLVAQDISCTSKESRSLASITLKPHFNAHRLEHSTIIKHLKVCFSSTQKCIVAYYFFDFQEIEKQSAINLVASIIVQLCHGRVSTPDQLDHLFRKNNNGNQRAALSDLTEALRTLMQEERDEFFIVIDALDECPKEEPREELLGLINTIMCWSVPKAHIMVTSRDERDIREALMPLLTSVPIPIEGASVDADIRLHVQQQLAVTRIPKTWSNELRIEVEVAIVAGAQGMFRWVSCQLDSLKNCLRPSAVRKALMALPKTLDETYERILKSIDVQSSQEALAALQWLAFSERPLSITELTEAVIINPQSNPVFDPQDRLPDPYAILSVLGSLVTVSITVPIHESVFGQGPSIVITVEDGAVRLAHSSVKEYLCSQRIREGQVSGYALFEDSSNRFIGACCLHYLLHFDEPNVAEFEGHSRYPRNNLFEAQEDSHSSSPLWAYAAQYCMSHARMAREGASDTIHELVQALFRSRTALCQWLDFCGPSYQLRPTSCIKGSERSRHAVYEAVFDDQTVCGPRDSKPPIDVEKLIDTILNRNPEVFCQMLVVFAPWYQLRSSIEIDPSAPPLHTAASLGYEEVVQILLDEGANPDAIYSGSTALNVAVSHKQRGVARLLLNAHADVNHKDTYEVSPLIKAIQLSQWLTVRLLVDYDANVNDHTLPPLHLAASLGSEPITRSLLEAGAHVDVVHHGNTPLNQAVSKRHGDVARTLLLFHADANHRDALGIPPLIKAVRKEEKWMVRRLLKNGARVNDEGPSGTALIEAVVCENEEIVGMLIKHKANINIKAPFGETPLMIAAQKSLQEDAWTIVKLLLEHGADIGIEDSERRTALDFAVIANNEGLVHLLSAGSNQFASKGIAYIHPEEMDKVVVAADENETSDCDTFSNITSMIPQE